LWFGSARSAAASPECACNVHFFEDQTQFLMQDETATARSLGQRADNANCIFGVLKSGDTSIGPPHIFALSEARAAHEAIGSIVLKA
jgi:hypothetical protein